MRAITNTGKDRLARLGCAAVVLLWSPLLVAAVHPAPHTPSAALEPAQPAAATHPSTAEDVVNGFHAALTRGDTAAALALMTEDVVVFESGGVEQNRTEYAAHHLEADAAFSAAVSRKLVSRQSGQAGDMAWVISIEQVTGTYRDRPINSRSVETMMLRQVDGLWRIAHIHWSSANIGPA
ncbi:MAG: nuclear transport factor 2 family protein [Sphingopyxis sp.]|nr:nuclear transport factor 2 family protein [Sphingopyxis sp.]